jgi:hypothetical protein
MLQGIETVHIVRKRRLRWLAKEDAIGQAHFISKLFGLAPNWGRSPRCPVRHPNTCGHRTLKGTQGS